MRVCSSRKAIIICRIFALLLGICLCRAAAMAEPTGSGWQTSNGQVSYYVNSSSGLIRLSGLQQVGESFYYFDAKGVLQTGWVMTADGYRYFLAAGEPGTLGKMLTGLQELNGNLYHFADNGVLSTGFLQSTNGSYYFKRKGGAGEMGAAVKKQWIRTGGARRYFEQSGRMAVSKWVGDYYVDSTGAMLTNAVTPDGYMVGSSGKKGSRVSTAGWLKVGGKWYYYNKKNGKLAKEKFKTIDGKTYYFNADGVRVKGWQIIGSDRYYFDSKGVRQTGKVTIRGQAYYFDEKGRLQVSRTVDGYVTDENGVITGKAGGRGAKVLVVAGHGQGDVGAVSSFGQEYKKTREFAKLICGELAAGGRVSVDYYMDGSVNYDLFQRSGAAMGTLMNSVTGKGTAQSKVRTALQKASDVPDLWEYDYVLEVHFNATAVAGKDPAGDGKCKGFGIYINSYKSSGDRGIDKKIVAAMKKAGSVVWGGGVLPSTGLRNARICNELGVNYSLIETAFIDDRDDMKFYRKNKQAMAAAVASAIEAYF